MKTTTIYYLVLLLAFYGPCSMAQKNNPAHRHIFSMTCKVDCINEEFNTSEGRQKAIDFFKKMHVELVYLESYRHGFSVPSELLEEVKNEFEKAGIRTAGCITPTQMSTVISTEWDIATCFSDPEGRKFLKETVIRTAKIFDLIILDDFYFMACQCDLCKAAKGDRSWSQFRIEHMRAVSKADVLEAAKVVNPNCEIIIKYPRWYEKLQDRGYDVINETAIFDFSFVGTETRDGGPQTQANWYQAWLNDVSNGKCAGGWYDPLGTSPETYVEQARQTILGGAKESLLHCYDYLATDRPGIAIHDGDEGVKNGRIDALALQQEIDGLQRLAEYIAPMKPLGVLLAKKPNERPEDDLNLIGKIGLLGIPFIASGTLIDNNSYFLTAHASNFDNLNIVVDNCIRTKKPLVLSKHAFMSLDQYLQRQLKDDQQIREHHFLILNSQGKSEEMIDPFKMDQVQLNDFRNRLLVPYAVQMEAPKNVSLHLFTSDKGNIEIVENFNDEPVVVKLIFNDKQQRKLKLGLPAKETVELRKISSNEYVIHLKPRSLVLIGN